MSATLRTIDSEGFTKEAEWAASCTPASSLMWFQASTRTLSTSEPSDGDRAEGCSVPVLTYSGLNVGDYAREQVCPSCVEPDALRYIGSRVATLVSVGLFNLFGMPSLAQEENQRLVFAD